MREDSPARTAVFKGFSLMIYLDNAATSFPKPEPVYEALDRFANFVKNWSPKMVSA